jgi:thiol:disulfide interchange protein DsbD
MKRLLFIYLFTIVCSTVAAQPKTAAWKVEHKAAGEGTVELIFTAEIEASWYIYSVQKTGGPQPTSVTFDRSTEYKLAGELTEGIPSKQKFDEAFQVNVNYFTGKAVLIQKIQRLTANEFTVKGTLEYQSCSDTQCIPNDYSFSVDIGKGAASAASDKVDIGNGTTSAASDKSDAGNSTVSAASDKIETASNGDYGNENVLMFILIAIGCGLMAILTPCVFPMIPMTVSFFMSGSSGRLATVTKAVIFFFSVGLIYGLIGVTVTIFKNPAIANVISSHYVPNLIFALMFIVFAVSFLGAFEITLPSGLANKADRQADRGGYMASFFMAVALATVSFSCTGPFVGALLPAAASGVSVVKPILGLFCFGLAMASPFLTVAIFPVLMDKLKSGSWLNSVKIVFAFIMLGFCVKFLTQADLSLGWNLITRDLAIAFWIVLSVLLGLYILGKIQFPHDSKVQHVTAGRLSLAIIAFVFALYLLPGMFGADLDAVSAFLPAKDRQQFDLAAARQTAGTANVAVQKKGTCDNTPKYAETGMHTPAGIKGYFDLTEAMECAKSLNRPILLDFTGHGCANCKKMEASTFKDQNIIELMNSEFVWLSLYYDDTTELPADEQTGEYKTLGKKNRAYQLKNFATIASPYFAVIDADGKILAHGLGFEEKAENFLTFANEGLRKFKESR